MGLPIWPASPPVPIRLHRCRFINCDPVCPQTMYVFVDQDGESRTGWGRLSGHLQRTERVGWIAAICLRDSLFRPRPDVPAERLPSYHSSVGSPAALSTSYVTVSPSSLIPYLFHLLCFLYIHNICSLLTYLRPTLSLLFSCFCSSLTPCFHRVSSPSLFPHLPFLTSSFSLFFTSSSSSFNSWCTCFPSILFF